MRSAGSGASHIFWSCSCGATFPQLMISGPRLFSKRHPAASKAQASAFDRRHPDCSNRFPTMHLQTLPRRRIRPAIRVCGRSRSAFGPCWPRSGGCVPRRLPPELRPADGAVRPVREDAEEGTSAAPEFRCSRARPRARPANRRAPTPCSPPDAASKTCAGPTSSIGGPVMPPPNPRKRDAPSDESGAIRLRIGAAAAPDFPKGGITPLTRSANESPFGLPRDVTGI